MIFVFDGNDKIIGGDGVDTLNGGAGPDEYAYTEVAEGGDIISSFDTADIFVFKGSAFGGLAAGVLQASQLVVRVDNVVQDANDRFIYNTVDDTLWFDSNGSAAGGPVLIADLSNFAFDLAAGDVKII